MPAPLSGTRKDKKHPVPGVGDVFGRWVVAGEPYKVKSRWRVPCRCECGVERAVEEQSLHKGASAGCGSCGTRLGGLTHGGSKTRLYNCWASMRRRCGDPGSSAYSNYGGRGITVCDEWRSYEAFRDWANANGYADDLTIDRIDNDGNYEPANCRWITRAAQTRNTRKNHKLTAFGETKCLVEWLEDSRCAVAYGTLWARLKGGNYSPEEAISRPV